MFAFRETDNWDVSEMNVPGYVCHGWGQATTAMLCPSQICKLRRSYERRIATLRGSKMVFSVYMPHGGYDEEDYITELELVKITMEEARAGGRGEGGEGFLGGWGQKH